MTELIKVKLYQNGMSAVSGRELHEFLGISTRYNDWILRMIGYGFVEKQDYELITQKKVTNNPKNPWTEITDHTISLDMAKHIAMMQKTPKGMMVRAYFIDVERKFFTDLEALKETIMSRSFEIGGQRIHLANIASISQSKTGAVTLKFDSSAVKVSKNLTINGICHLAEEYGDKIDELLLAIKEKLSIEQYERLVNDINDIFYCSTHHE